MAGLDGILLVNKPIGVISFDVIRRLKPYLPKGTKVGYLGILDPMAQGVFPLLLGKATRLAPFLEDGVKVYEGTIRLGIVTDTQDRDGTPLRVEEDLGAFDLSPERIREAFARFQGKIQQVPPMYSAKKYKGQPLYRYARRGLEVPRGPKEVEIYRLELKGVELPFLSFYLECSKGTYVRTLAHDIGEVLGCGGTLWNLTRLRNGPFRIEDSRSLEDILALARSGRIQEAVWDLDRALAHLPALCLEGENLYRVLHGGAIFLTGDLPEGRVRLLDGQGRFVGLGEVSALGKEKMVRPLRILGGRG